MISTLLLKNNNWIKQKASLERQIKKAGEEMAASQEPECFGQRIEQLHRDLAAVKAIIGFEGEVV